MLLFNGGDGMTLSESYINQIMNKSKMLQENVFVDTKEFKENPYEVRKGKEIRQLKRIEANDEIDKISDEVTPVISKTPRYSSKGSLHSGEVGYKEDPSSRTFSTFNEELNQLVKNLRKFGGVPSPVSVGSFDDGTEIPYWESGIRIFGDFIKPTEVLGFPRLEGLDTELKTEYCSAGSPRVVSMFDDGLHLTITPGL